MTASDFVRGEAFESDKDDEQRLIERARGGENDAIAELWRRHYAGALYVARSFDGIDPEDVVAESFYRVFKAVRSGKGPTRAFGAYVRTAVANSARSALSRGREVSFPDLGEFVGTVDLDDDALLHRDERSGVERAFRALPDRFQQVLWLFDVEGKTPREVGPLLGITPNAASALVIRARGALRRSWVKVHLSETPSNAFCRQSAQRWQDGSLSVVAKPQDLSLVRESSLYRQHVQDCDWCQRLSRTAPKPQALSLLLLLAVGPSVLPRKEESYTAHGVPAQLGQPLSPAGGFIQATGLKVLSIVVCVSLSFPLVSSVPFNSPGALDTAELVNGVDRGARAEASLPAPSQPDVTEPEGEGEPALLDPELSDDVGRPSTSGPGPDSEPDRESNVGEGSGGGGDEDSVPGGGSDTGQGEGSGTPPTSPRQRGVGDRSDSMLYTQAGPPGTVIDGFTGAAGGAQSLELPFEVEFFGQTAGRLCVSLHGSVYFSSTAQGCFGSSPYQRLIDSVGSVDAPNRAVIGVLGAGYSNAAPLFRVWSDVAQVDLSGSSLSITTSEPHDLAVGDRAMFWSADPQSNAELRGVSGVVSGIGSSTTINMTVSVTDGLTQGAFTGAIVGVPYRSSQREPDSFAAVQQVYAGPLDVGDSTGFAVTWYRVRSFPGYPVDPRDSNTFQLVLIPRSPQANPSSIVQDFDIVLNYGTLQSTVGGYNGVAPSGGPCGSDQLDTCRLAVGIASALSDSEVQTFELFPQTPAEDLADDAASPLSGRSLGTDVTGRIVIPIRAGVPTVEPRAIVQRR